MNNEQTPRSSILTSSARALAITVALAATGACSDDGNDGDVPADVNADSADTQVDADAVERDVADPDAGDDTGDDTDAEPTDAVPTDSAADVPEDTVPDVYEPPPVTDAARARGFQLFYRERLDRSLVAYNRFALFGDVGWGLAVDRANIARDGDDYEVVVGPKDNNLMGTPIRSVWHAYRNTGSRAAELTLMRQLNGMLFFAQVSGHPGVTARMAIPGWTLGVDGVDGTSTRTRNGEPVDSPLGLDSELEDEIIETFFDGVRMTYRMDPRDTMLSFYPAHDPADYAITISMPDLPHFIRISDCCATLFRTPEGNTWTDSWWTNHNSRDNYPDIALGLIAGLEAEGWSDTPEPMRDLAEQVGQAGRVIADHIEANGGNIMTVDEFNPYDVLVPSGLIRPHGLEESEGLGGMASCPMALLNRALTTSGLASEPPNLMLPGSPEYLITPDIETIIECPYEEPRTCVSIEDAWCGHTWESIFDLQILGQNWLELARNMEAASPGSSGDLLGAFQNDYDDVVESMVALIATLDAQGDVSQARRARRTLQHMTNLMREFADVIYGGSDPERAAEQRYEAAIFDALGGLPVIEEDLDGFAREETRIARLEGLLDVAAAEPADLMTDEEIRQIVTDGLADLQDRSGPGRSDAVRARYAEAYPDGEPPLRRAGDAYEARQGQGEWMPAERPRHRGYGSPDFLQSIVLCSTAPHILDCGWARLGCEAPDIDDSGSVDEADQGLLQAALDEHGDGAACADATACDGADIDQSGVLDASDQAFMDAAMGCIR